MAMSSALVATSSPERAGAAYEPALGARVCDALKQNDERADAELIGAVLFARTGADELRRLVHFIRTCVEAQIARVRTADSASAALSDYVVDLERRVREASEARRAAVSDADELVDAISDEDRALLAQTAQTAACLHTELRCLRALEQRNFDAADDRLVAQVTFFYFLSCSRDLREFAFCTQHEQRDARRTCMTPTRRAAFVPGLQQIAERYANHEMDGAQFVRELQQLYMLCAVDVDAPSWLLHNR